MPYPSANYTPLDDEERAAYLAALQPENSLRDACKTVGICEERIRWHRKIDAQFDYLLKDHSQKLKTKLCHAMVLQRQASAGLVLTPDQKTLVADFVSRGKSEREACKLAEIPLQAHNLTKRHDFEYAEALSLAYDSAKAVLINQVELKLLRMLLTNWKNVTVEWRAKMNNNGRPILDQHGRSRLYIHKVTESNLTKDQLAAIKDILCLLLPTWQPKQQVKVTHETIQSPDQLRTLIVQRINELDVKPVEPKPEPQAILPKPELNGVPMPQLVQENVMT